MAKAADESVDRTQRGMTATAMTKRLAADAIFLGGEGKGDKRGGSQVVEGARKKLQSALANPAAYVLHTKEVVGARAGATTIFPRA